MPRRLFLETSAVAAALVIALPCAAQKVQQQTATLPPSPIARIEIMPRNRTVTAGDSIQLCARAVDASRQTVRGANARKTGVVP